MGYQSGHYLKPPEGSLGQKLNEAVGKFKEIRDLFYGTAIEHVGDGKVT